MWRRRSCRSALSSGAPDLLENQEAVGGYGRVGDGGQRGPQPLGLARGDREARPWTRGRWEPAERADTTVGLVISPTGEQTHRCLHTRARQAESAVAPDTRGGAVPLHVTADQPNGKEPAMPALLILHDVDDVDHWLKSPKRNELFAPRGFTARTFVDPTDSHRVGLVVEGATPKDFDELMGSQETSDAMKHDGVRADTVRMLEER